MGCFVVCWTDSVDVTFSLKACRRIAVDAPAIALAVANGGQRHRSAPKADVGRLIGAG